MNVRLTGRMIRPLSALAGAACAVAALAYPTAAAAAPTAAPAVTGACKVTALPVPHGTRSSEVFGGDPSGRYLIGHAVTENATATSLLWVNGKLADTPTRGGDSTLVDVNRSGTIVGYDSTFPQRKGWVYSRGRFTSLPGLTRRTPPSRGPSTGAATSSASRTTGSPAVTSRYGQRTSPGRSGSWPGR